ncbi:MAG: sensor histidine kinase [Lachnospiraceae bacterium]
MHNQKIDDLNYNNIKDVYIELQEEREVINRQITDNLNDIREIELYLESLFEKEDIDYEIFSPRNVQSVFKDKIESQKNTKKEIEEKNSVLYKKSNIYTRKMDKLSVVLQNIGMDDNKDISSVFEDDFLEKNKEIDFSNIVAPLEKNKINYTILDIQEKERQRIARDLHDSTVQNLTHLIHKIELSSKFLDQDIVRAKMELVSVNQNIKNIINDMRNIIFDLRPMEFDDMGMEAAFDKLLLELQLKTKMKIAFHIQKIPNENELRLISIFRIVQECCNNAIKHSNGNTLEVIIEQKKDKLFITIQDDGVGFDVKKIVEDRHFGLSMTKERVSLLYGKMKSNHFMIKVQRLV